MALFCDICGTKFEEGDLRPQSKFCLVCGEELSLWIKNKLQTRTRVPVLTEIRGQSRSPRNPRSASALAEHGICMDDPPNIGITNTDNSPPLSEYGHSELEDVEGSSIVAPLSPQTTVASAPRDNPELSLDINTYDFPPSFPVPSRYNQPFHRRKVITKILGGNNQTTYPTSVNGSGVYACLRMDMNPLSPPFAGAHGIIITRPIPKTLPRDNFTLFVRDTNKPVWRYRGQYRIRFESYMTPEQWNSQSNEFKKDHTTFVLDNKNWGRKELARLGLNADFRSTKQAIEKGDIKWEVKVIECVGFDVELYSQLLAFRGA